MFLFCFLYQYIEYYPHEERNRARSARETLIKNETAHARAETRTNANTHTHTHIDRHINTRARANTHTYACADVNVQSDVVSYICAQGARVRMRVWRDKLVQGLGFR